MVSALPAMSLNSAPGLRERINVAADGRVSFQKQYMRGEWPKKEATRTSKDDAKIARRHQIRLVVFLNPAGEDHTSAKACQITIIIIGW
jgi:hypothetical protein